MAERRMFAKSIVNSARFLRMPPTSRLLYYDLGMAADDDGIAEGFTVIRTTGATEDDLRVLTAKNFVQILNEDMVCLVVDWKRNNLIAKDRYHASVYADLINDSSADIPLLTTCIQPVNNLLTQVRLGKDSLDEGSQDENSQDENSVFDVWWKEYPKKVGKQDAKKSYAKALKMPGVTAKLLLTAVQEQKMSEQWAKDNGQYIPNPATWLNQGRWDDELERRVTNGRTEKHSGSADSRWNIHYTNE